MTAVIAMPAMAQDLPLVRPNQDVVVAYRTTGMAQPGDGTITIRFANKGHRMRIDGASGGAYEVFDTDTNRTLIVLPDKHGYLDQPSDPNQMPMFLSSNATFTRTGSATIAGIKCTSYMSSINNQSGQTCLTDDGVMLLAKNVDQGPPRQMEAVSVTYAAQASALFEPPAGFQKIDPPRARAPMNDLGPLDRPPGNRGIH
jgi:hypothetical protein